MTSAIAACWMGVAFTSSEFVFPSVAICGSSDAISAPVAAVNVVGLGVVVPVLEVAGVVLED